MLFILSYIRMRTMQQSVFPVARHRGIMCAIRLMRPRCDYCKDTKKICKGRTGEACMACAQLCSHCPKAFEDLDITDDGSSTESEASVTESESSDSSDDVIVLDHKPDNWIDRSPRKPEKRRREEDSDDEVVVLDGKPTDWIDGRKRRRQDSKET
ncbi:hypothetical protein EV424DRAFT_1347480 [Suillus variegatus]|nr:hypothetical protein EV424DRAFT_1347480 [Suillus variegatus]